MSTYTADSPLAIAEHFERMAKALDARIPARTKLQSMELKAEARAWRAAADMIRNTTFSDNATPQAEPTKVAQS